MRRIICGRSNNNTRGPFMVTHGKIFLSITTRGDVCVTEREREREGRLDGRESGGEMRELKKE